jgi:hypothetical protein
MLEYKKFELIFMDNATKYALFLIVSCLLITCVLWLPDIMGKD